MSRSLLASMILLAATSGCTSIQRLDAPALRGDPDSTCVLVVEPDITVVDAIHGTRWDGTGVGGVVARADGTKELVRGDASSGYVIFPDLPPGRWQLLMIEADWNPGCAWRNACAVPPEQAEAFTFDLRPGEPVYVRPEIEDRRRANTYEVSYARREDPERERKAWAWMSGIYEDTAWELVFLSKAGSAEAKPRTAAAPKSGE